MLKLWKRVSWELLDKEQDFPAFWHRGWVSVLSFPEKNKKLPTFLLPVRMKFKVFCCRERRREGWDLWSRSREFKWAFRKRSWQPTPGCTRALNATAKSECVCVFSGGRGGVEDRAAIGTQDSVAASSIWLTLLAKKKKWQKQIVSISPLLLCPSTTTHPRSPLPPHTHFCPFFQPSCL